MKFNHLNVPTHWRNYWSRYPEGHTILEALISWVSQVDSMVDNQNKLNDNVEQFRNEIDDFIGRFDERLQDEVTQTLKDWQNSGFLNVVISEALQWQLDDYIATNEQDKLSLTAQMEETKRDYVNALSFGLDMDNVDADNTQKMQDAIDYCIENNKTLYLPSGYIYIKGQLVISKSIHIVGKNGSTFSRRTSMIMYNGGQDIPVILIEDNDRGFVPSVKLEKFGIARRRTFGEDGYNDDNPFAVGRKCTGIKVSTQESTFNDLLILGFKTGMEIFGPSMIINIHDCDFLMNETQLKIASRTVATSIENNNFCYTDTTLLLNSGAGNINFVGNHSETAKRHFDFRLSINKTYQGINIMNNNFTSFRNDADAILYIETPSESIFCEISKITFQGNRGVMNSGHMLYFNQNNNLARAEVDFINNSLWCDKELVSPSSGTGLRFIYNDGYYRKQNGSLWTDLSYLDDKYLTGYCYALSSTETFRGLKSPLNLKKYDYQNYPSVVKGSMYYNDTSTTVAFHDSNYRYDLLKSRLYRNLTWTKPSETVGNGTLFQNTYGLKGSPVGWVYSSDDGEHHTFGQLGYRSQGISPIGSLLPRMVGEETFDSVTKTWYKAVGLTNQDWKPMTQ